MLYVARSKEAKDGLSGEGTAKKRSLFFLSARRDARYYKGLFSLVEKEKLYLEAVKKSHHRDKETAKIAEREN